MQQRTQVLKAAQILCDQRSLSYSYDSSVKENVKIGNFAKGWYFKMLILCYVMILH